MEILPHLALLAISAYHFLLAYLALLAMDLLAREQLIEVDDGAFEAIGAVVLENPRSSSDEEDVEQQLIQLIDGQPVQRTPRRVRATAVPRLEAENLPPALIL